jgi:alkylation response protein AidB-like acyl-CoA dehydrogenase
MTFYQAPPALGNQYYDDRVLRSYLARSVPSEVLRETEPSLVEMGRLSGGDLYQMQLADRRNEPELRQWDAWGDRTDHIELTPLWRRAEAIAAEHGLVATAYERRHGRYSRIHQCALAYLFTPSTDIYSCPLAMTDGAASTLLSSGNQALIERVVPHLTTRNPLEFWTSGQWMTELTGGSDVGLSETVARQGADGVWRLFGRKWFTSAATSQVALTLARPEGNPSGGRGLALFLVQSRNDAGRLQNIQINRLKEKLGTRKVPTAELTLDGTPATLVMRTTDGVRNIAPMLNITRLWNGISAVALMRRGVALAVDYARKRTAFGTLLIENPLHLDTLADLQAETEAAFHFAFYVAELTGRAEAGEIDEDQALLRRLLTPLMKLTTGKQAVHVASEVLEAFGGAGYVEDTGLPVLLRDSQVLPIWEGTTNVLSLDALRALGEDGRAFEVLKAEVNRILAEVRASNLAEAARMARAALGGAEGWLIGARKEGEATMAAGARRFTMTLGRTIELTLLTGHAQWALDHEADERPTLAARRFAVSGIDLIVNRDIKEARGLFTDQPT